MYTELVGLKEVYYVSTELMLVKSLELRGSC